VKRWKARTLATVLTVLTLLVVWTIPAYATSHCFGHVIGDLSNTFTVCIVQMGNGYDARVIHEAGPQYLVDFNLATNTGWVGDEGPFWISGGDPQRTYFFNTGPKQWARVYLFWRAGSPEFSPLYSPVCPPNCG
jgi:hypothetical protein